MTKYEPDQLPTRCPRCFAPAGEPCHTRTQKPTSRVHNGRVIADPYRATTPTTTAKGQAR